MPSPKTIITADELKSYEDIVLRSRGLDPSRMSELERENNFLVKTLRDKYEIKAVSPISVAKGKQESDKARADTELGLKTQADKTQDITEVSIPEEEIEDFATQFTSGQKQVTGPYGTTREATGLPIVETPLFFSKGPAFADVLGPQSSNVLPGSVEEQVMKREDEPKAKGFELQTSNEEIITKAQEDALKAIHQEEMDFGWAYTKQFTDEQREKEIARRWKGMVKALSDPKKIRRKSEEGVSQTELNADIFGKTTTLGDIPDINLEDSKTIQHFRTALIKQKQADLEAHGTNPSVSGGEAIAWSNSILGKPQWWQNPSQKAAKLREAPETYSVLGFGVDVYPSGTVIETTPAQFARVINSGSSMISGMVGSVASEVTPGLAKARKESEVAPILDITGSTGIWDKAVDSGLMNIKTGRGVAEESYDAATNAGAPDWAKKTAYGTGLLVDIVAMPIVPGSGAIKGGVRASKELAFAAKVLGEGADLSKGEKAMFALGRVLEANPVTKAIGKRLDLIPGDIRLLAAERAFANTNDLGHAFDAVGRARAYEKAGLSNAPAGQGWETIGEAGENIATRTSGTFPSSKSFLDSLADTNPVIKKMIQDLGKDYTITQAFDYLKGKVDQSDILKKAGDAMAAVEDSKTNPWAIYKGASNKLFKAEDVPRWIQDTLRMNPDMAKYIREGIEGGVFEGSPKAVLAEILSKAGWRKELLRTITLDKTLGHVIEETSKLPAWRALDANPFYLLTGKTAVTSEDDAAKILKAARETDVAKAIQEGAKGKLEGVLKQAQEADAELAGGFYQSRIPLTADHVETIYKYIDSKKRGSLFNSELLDALETDIAAGGLRHGSGGFTQTISTDSARKLIEMQIDDVARLPIDGKILAITEKDIAKLPQAAQTALMKPVVLRPGWVVKELGKLKGDSFGSLDKFSIPAQKALAAMQAEMAGIDKSLSLKIKELTTDEKLWSLYGFTSKPTDRQAMLALIFVSRPKIFGDAPGFFGSSIGKLVTDLGDGSAKARLIADLVEDLAIGGRSTWSKLSDLISPIAISKWQEAQLLVQAELDAAKKTLRLTLIAEASQHGSDDMLLALEAQADAVRQYLTKVAEITAPHKGKGLHTLPAGNVEELLTGIYFTLEKDEIIQKHLTDLVSKTKTLQPSREIESILENALTNFLSRPGAKPFEISFTPKKPGAPVDQLRYPVVKNTLEDVGDATPEQIRALRAERAAELDQMGRDLVSIRFKDIAQGRAFDYMDFTMRINASQPRLAGALFHMGDANAAKLFTAVDEIAQDIADANQLAKQVDVQGVTRMKKIQAAIARGQPPVFGPDETAIVKALVESSFDATKVKDSLGKIAADPKLLQLFTKAKDGLLEVQYSLMLSLRTRFHGANFLTAPFIMMSTLGGEETVKALSSWLDGARLSAFTSDLGKMKISEGIELDPFKADLGRAGRIDTVAFTDVAGRAYTWRDLAEIAREGSILKTQKGSPGATKMLRDNASFLAGSLPKTPWGAFKWLYKQPGKVVDFAQSFAEFSDGSFRLATLISSLKRGEDVSQALQKSREALFDYGKMTDWERKYIASWFQFYSFTRASTMSTFWNLIENPTRVANQLKLAKGAPLWGDDKDRSLFYEQDYMQLRPLLSMTTGLNDRVGVYGPPLPGVDSFVLLSKVLGAAFNHDINELPITDVTTERTNVGVKSLVDLYSDRGQLKTQVYENGYLDPRFVVWIKASGRWEWFVQTFKPQITTVSEDKTKTTFQEATPSDRGYTYQLVPKSKEAMLFYKAVLAAQFFGATSMVKDYAPLMASGADLSKEGPDLTTSPSELFGATTDVRMDLPEDVNLKVRAREAGNLKQYQPQ